MFKWNFGEESDNVKSILQCLFNQIVLGLCIAGIFQDSCQRGHMEYLERKSQEFLWVVIRPRPNGELPKPFKFEGGVRGQWVVLAKV